MKTDLLQAVYDAEFGSPACKSEISLCDTGNLVDGRGKVGVNSTTEINFPNTIDNCKDGNKVSYSLISVNGRAQPVGLDPIEPNGMEYI